MHVLGIMSLVVVDRHRDEGVLVGEVASRSHKRYHTKKKCYKDSIL
jgi:hypothetical protein